MQQPTLSLKIPSELYKNIAYSVFINPTPTTGTLNYAILHTNVNVSCIISIKDSLLDDYEFAVITVAYKQVSTKSKRFKSVLKDPLSRSNMLYRASLDSMIKEYKTLFSKETYAMGRALLLNETVTNQDARVGDTGIQCMCRFQKFDGSSEFILCPGGPLVNLVSMIGLSVFEADSVEEVLDSIILKMADLIKTHILPSSGLVITSDLDADIIRYLKFAFYGECYECC